MPKIDRIKTQVDQDGDVLMSNAPPMPSNPLKDKFNFDWFSFDSKLATPKSPASASTTDSRSVSTSTASPSSYFISSPNDSETSSWTISDSLDGKPLHVKYPAPPARPLKWVWQCHMCHSRYPLSVTQRCLIDGHFYCSGNSPAQRNIKKRRKQQSCTSEFDYVAWKDWGQWKRKTMALKAVANGKGEPKLLGCEGCSSPSQCRHEKRKRVETIHFDEYIEEKDVIMDDEQQIAAKVSKRRSMTRSGSPSSASGQKSSAGNRFYSTISSSLSNRDVSPTSESLGAFSRGKFDPTLPSAKTAVNEESDLSAVETTLKTTLVSKNQRLPVSTSKIVSRLSASKPKRRINTKIDDPQFEITPEDIKIGPTIGYGGSKLERNKSQQNLLSDFFRQSKVVKEEDAGRNKTLQRAASEADITAFLESKPTLDKDEMVMLKPKADGWFTVQSGQTQDFEDVNVSPAAKSDNPLLAVLRAKGQTPEDERIDNSAKDIAQVNIQGENGRAGFGLMLPSFVFGRK